MEMKVVNFRASAQATLKLLKARLQPYQLSLRTVFDSSKELYIRIRRIGQFASICVATYCQDIGSFSKMGLPPIWYARPMRRFVRSPPQEQLQHPSTVLSVMTRTEESHWLCHPSS
jgi:hypothetical protein